MYYPVLDTAKQGIYFQQVSFFPFINRNLESILFHFLLSFLIQHSSLSTYLCIFLLACATFPFNLFDMPAGVIPISVTNNEKDYYHSRHSDPNNKGKRRDLWDILMQRECQQIPDGLPVRSLYHLSIYLSISILVSNVFLNIYIDFLLSTKDRSTSGCVTLSRRSMSASDGDHPNPDPVPT